MREERLLALIDTDRRRLVRAATRLLGPAEAEDAVQDAYVRALEADRLALEVAPAWLLTVVRHLAIDRLRRRHWLQQWAVQTSAGIPAPAAPSAEADAALAQDAARALRLIAAELTPADGAAVLLYEVFEAGHAEIAQAGGRSEAGSRQQLRRALLRLREAARVPDRRPPCDRGQGDETALRLYLHALRLRDPQTLWAMLREPPVQAAAALGMAAVTAAPAPTASACGVVQVGGQLALVLTLGGVTLCAVPLGVRPGPEVQAALQAAAVR